MAADGLRLVPRALIDACGGNRKCLGFLAWGCNPDRVGERMEGATGSIKQPTSEVASQESLLAAKAVRPQLSLCSPLASGYEAP